MHTLIQSQKIDNMRILDGELIWVNLIEGNIDPFVGRVDYKH